MPVAGTPAAAPKLLRMPQAARAARLQDHDSGWNNGDGRNPVKHDIKNLYLDAIGEPQVGGVD